VRFLEVLSLIIAENFDTIRLLCVRTHNRKRLVSRGVLIVDLLLRTSAQVSNVVTDVTRCSTHLTPS